MSWKAICTCAGIVVHGGSKGSFPNAPASYAHRRRPLPDIREQRRILQGLLRSGWFADFAPCQLRDIRQGIRRLRAMGVTSSELERKEVDRLWATLVVVENAMDDGWPDECLIKFQLC